MTKNEILQKLKELKPKYEEEGFLILGLFGSYARDEATEIGRASCRERVSSPV